MSFRKLRDTGSLSAIDVLELKSFDVPPAVMEGGRGGRAEERLREKSSRGWSLSRS
jgi:hypothetical protein